MIAKVPTFGRASRPAHDLVVAALDHAGERGLTFDELQAVLEPLFDSPKIRGDQVRKLWSVGRLRRRVDGTYELSKPTERRFLAEPEDEDDAA